MIVGSFVTSCHLGKKCVRRPAYDTSKSIVSWHPSQPPAAPMSPAVESRDSFLRAATGGLFPIGRFALGVNFRGIVFQFKRLLVELLLYFKKLFLLNKYDLLVLICFKSAADFFIVFADFNLSETFSPNNRLSRFVSLRVSFDSGFIADMMNPRRVLLSHKWLSQRSLQASLIGFRIFVWFFLVIISSIPWLRAAMAMDSCFCFACKEASLYHIFCQCYFYLRIEGRGATNRPQFFGIR